ncbi:MAG: hypothetical protein HY550_08210 [Elusimicrobia bacterium]|nr:hypothetical protein [Elusimicrobiota bacterium]
MKIKHGLAAAAALAFLFLAGVQTFAASPAQVSYQGTLRKNGVLFSGTAAMEFRITNADGSAVYWASGSTDVVVSTGLFRYALGSPNEVDFGNIVWKEITPYVQMNLDGGWLPREPLYTSVYSLHSRTAESSTGTFTVNGGDLKLVSATGSKGIYFQDGTAQYSAPGWVVTGAYTSFAGGAGVGTLTPATRLDVKGAAADPYIQFWRDENGVVKATMTAAGLLYADGSQLSNLPAGADNMGNHTATQALSMAAFPVNNAGAITANGQVTTYSSATVVSAFGLGAPRVRLAGGVEVSSYSAGGVYISSNVTLASGGRYFGDGSRLTGVNDSLGSHIATQTLNMAGYEISGVSTITVAAALRFDANVAVSSAAGLYSGIYISTNVNIAPGARYYGDGSGLTGIVGVDNLGNHTMTQGLATGPNWISYDGSPSGLNLDALGNIGVNQAAGSASLDVRGAGGSYIQIWRNSSGVIRASMTVAGAFYADGSQLRNVPAGGTANQALNMASFDIANVSTVTLSSVTSSGIGVVFSTNVLLMNGRLGVNTSLPQESLDVNGNFKSSSLSGFGNQCVYADDNGRLLLSGSGLCGSASGLDNLGNRIMLGNLITGSNWISFDGSAGGLSVNVSSNVGIGVLSAATRLDVQGRSGDSYVQIWRDSAGVIKASMTAAGLLYADASQMVNLPSGGDSLGDHTSTQTLDMSGFQIVNAGSVTVTAAAGVGAARLSLNTNVEISSETDPALGAGLRVSSNVYIVGFSSAAKYYGDGSGLTGVISSPDGLGNHTATQDLAMTSFDITGVSTITVSSVTGTGIGVVFSTNVLIMSGNLGVNKALPQASLDVNGNIMSSSLSGAGDQCVYADNTGRLLLSGVGTCGSAAGLDNLGNRIMLGNLITGSNWISFDGSNGGLSVNISSNVGIGILSAATRLDVQAAAGDIYAQIWRNSAGVIQASMSATGELYADASRMRNLPSGADDLGSHTATQDLDLASSDIIGVSTITAGYLTSAGPGVIFSTNLLVMDGSLGVSTLVPQEKLHVTGKIRASSLSGSGNRCVQANDSGVLGLSADACGLAGAGGDNLGDYTMTFNLLTNGNWLSGDGGNEGIQIDSLGNVSIGDSANNARLDVRGGALTNIQVWRDVAGVTRASISSGGGLAASSATVNGQLTVNSSATVTAAQGLGSPKLKLSSNVEISSETAASYGGGVRVSSNVYIVGYSSAARYYGDGSALTGLTGLNASNISAGTLSDARLSANVPLLDAVNTFSSSLTVTGAGGARLARIGFNDAVEFSSAAAGSYGGVQFSTHVFLPAGAKYYGDGSQLTGVSGSDDLGNHTATQDLDLNTFNLVNVASLTARGAVTAYSSVTVAGDLGLGAALRFDNNVELSSSTGLNRGIQISTNVYIVGIASAAKYYGDGSGLYGVTGDNIIDTLAATLTAGSDAGGSSITNLGSLTAGADITAGGSVAASGDVTAAGHVTAGGPLTTYSSATVAGALGLGAARLRFSAGVEISSQTSAALGGGVGVSSNVYIVGFSSAAKYYGDGSSLTGVSDDLGNHTATADLNMASNDILSVSTITVGYLFSQGAGVAFTTNAFILGGRLGINTSLPQESLDVNGNIMSASLSGFGDRCVYADTTGKLQLAGDVCGTGAGTDNMGNHTMTQNLKTGGNLITYGPGVGSGLSINISSNVGIGLSNAATRLDAQTGLGDPYMQFWRDSGGTIIASMSATGSLMSSRFVGDGSGLSKLPPLPENLITNGFWLSNDGVNGGIYVNASNNVGVGTPFPGASLDVKASGAYAQLWRDSGDLAVATMTAEGLFSVSSNVYIAGFSSASVYYGAGSALTGLNASNIGAGTLADARLSANVPLLDAANTFSSSITVTGVAGARLARIGFNDAAELSSAAAGNYGGVQFSTNVFLPAGAKYYGDGSALTGISGPDDLGNHIATADLNMNNFNLLNVGAIAPDPASSVTVVGVLQSFGSGYTQIWRNSIGVAVASMTDAGVLYADGSQLTGVAGGGSLSALLASSPDAANGYIINLSSLAAGRSVAYAPLDVQASAAGTNSQIWRDEAGVYVASMSAAGAFYAGSAVMNSAELYSSLVVNNVEISSHMSVGNQGGVAPSVVVMASSVIEEADIDNVNPNVGVLGAALLNPTAVRSGSGPEMVIGGNFRGGIVPGMGVDKDFPTLMGLRTAAWANTSGQVTNAYGIWVQNEQTAGVVVNNYGVYVATPVLSGGAITNNYGIYISTQSGLGAATDYNIYSAGAGSVNRFEGAVRVDGALRLASKTKAEILLLDPVDVGEMYYCSDCTPKTMVVSTGTAVGNFANGAGGAF